MENRQHSKESNGSAAKRRANGALTRRELMGASLLGAGLAGTAATPLEAASTHGCQPAKPIVDVPSAMQLMAMNWACMSVGKAG